MNLFRIAGKARRTLYLLPLLALSFAFGDAVAAPGPLRVGVTCPLTGASADMGISMRNGAGLAVEEINSFASGVLGRKIELVERDDQANPETGKKIAEGFAGNDKVAAVIGICNTGVGMAAIDTYQKARLPLIIPVATGTPLTKKFAPPAAAENFIFRVSPRDELQAPFIVANAMKNGFRKFALFADTTGYGDAGKADIEKALSAHGLRPVTIARFAIGTKDLDAQVKEARAAGADVVVSYTVGAEAAVLARAIQAQKWKVQLIGSWPLSWRAFIDGAGAAGDGALVVQSFIQHASFQNRDAFSMAYERRHQNALIPAPMAAAQGYDAMMLLFYAINKAQSDDPVKIKEALEDLDRFVSGVITSYEKPFSKTDHDAITGNMLVMGIVRKGRVEYAYKEDAKRASIVERKQ